MEALIPAFIAVLLAETGGKVQSLATRGPGNRAMLLALGLSTLISLGIAAGGAILIADSFALAPRTLLAGLALLFAGAPMLLPAKPAKPRDEGRGFAGHLFGFLAAQIGDASQFIVFAIAARSNMAPLAFAGGVAAVLAAGAMPSLFASEWPDAKHLMTLRRIAAILLLLAGLWCAATALRVI